MRTHSNQTNGAVRVATVAALFGIAAAAVTSGAALADQRPSTAECIRGLRGTADTLEHWSFTCVVSDTPIVVGTGPEAVYVGPLPTFGGDPARGETEYSYYARSGRHLPSRSTATVTVTGGDRAPGETDDSYYARTGRG